MRAIMTALFCLGILTAFSEGANAQGIIVEQTTIQRPYQVKHHYDRQEAYPGGYVDVVRNGKKVQMTRSIRFINFDYFGPARADLWRTAFEEAAAYYKREGVTYHKGRDSDFFLVSGLSASHQRIVGWNDDATGQYGYAVITQVTESRVNYTMNWGPNRVAIANPNNFEDWTLGSVPGDWDAGWRNVASVQLWHHTDSGTQAAVTFWLRGLRP